MTRYKKEVSRVLQILWETRENSINEEDFKNAIGFFSNFDYAICMAVVHQAYRVGWHAVDGEPVYIDLRPLEKAAINIDAAPTFTFESVAKNVFTIMDNCWQLPWPRWECVYRYFDLLVEADKFLDDEDDEEADHDDEDEYYNEEEDYLDYPHYL